MTDSSKWARPYAKAVFEYAVEHKQLDQWSKKLHQMVECMQQPEVTQFLSNPNYGVQERLDVCVALLKDSVDETGINFIKILATHNRLSVLPAILELFEQYRAIAQQVLDVAVKSAVPLTGDYQAKLNKILSHKFGCDIVLQCEVQPTLLGGLIITAGDHVIDGSVRGQLQRLREHVLS